MSTFGLIILAILLLPIISFATLIGVVVYGLISKASYKKGRKEALEDFDYKSKYHGGNP